MKVFEVITEDSRNKEIIISSQYVSGENIKQVFEYFYKHCEQYELELMSVSYAVTVVQQIDYEDILKESY